MLSFRVPGTGFILVPFRFPFCTALKTGILSAAKRCGSGNLECIGNKKWPWRWCQKACVRGVMKFTSGYFAENACV